MKCSLTEKVQRSCRVKSCLYYSHINQTHCFADSVDDLDLEGVALHKGLSENSSKLFRIKKMAVTRIQIVLYLDEFLEWVAKKPPVKSKYTLEAFSDSPVFAIAELHWTDEKLRKLLHASYRKEFEKQNGTVFPPLESIFEISQKKLVNLLQTKP